MTKKRTLTTVAEIIPKLEKRLAAKQKARQDVKKKIKDMYHLKVLEEQTPTEDIYRYQNIEEQVEEDSEVLEKESLRLSYEISALTDLIEDAKREIFDLAQAEIEKIPEQITALQASFLKKSESVQRELMEALERVSYLIRRLKGIRSFIPWTGNLVLPSLPQASVIESNLRLDILMKDQPKEGDPYDIKLKIRWLRDKQAGGAEKIAEAAMVNARQ